MSKSTDLSKEDISAVNKSSVSLNARDSGQSSTRGFGALSSRGGIVATHELTIQKNDLDPSSEEIKKKAAEIAGKVIHDISSKPIPIRQQPIKAPNYNSKQQAFGLNDDQDDSQPLISSPKILQDFDNPAPSGNAESYNMAKMQLNSAIVSLTLHCT